MPAPTWYSVARVTSPFSISDAFAVVPPMSNEIALSIPTSRVNACTPTAPAAGPDSMICIGVSAAGAGPRPVLDYLHRRPPRPLRGRHPAIRLHQQERRVEADALPLAREPV